MRWMIFKNPPPLRYTQSNHTHVLRGFGRSFHKITGGGCAKLVSLVSRRFFHVRIILRTVTFFSVHYADARVHADDKIVSLLPDSIST